MKKINKVTVLVLVLVLATVMLCFSSCEKVTNESDAINLVRNYPSYDYFPQKIGTRLGLLRWDEPVFTSREAVQTEDGNWEVEMLGEVTGCQSSGQERTYTFTVTAVVSKRGEVVSFHVDKGWGKD